MDRKDAPKLGGKVRALRRRAGLTQQALAERLKVSAAYMNLIENNRRPLPAHLLIELAQLFSVDLGAFSSGDEGELTQDLFEVFGDPLFEGGELTQQDVRSFAQEQPQIARQVHRLYRAYRETREGSFSLEPTGDAPSEEVSDLLQRHRNHVPALEEAAEAVRRQCAVKDDDLGRGLASWLQDKHGVTVEIQRKSSEGDTLRRYDPAGRRLLLSELLPPRSRNFQLAHQIAFFAAKDVLEAAAHDDLLTSDASRALAQVAFANLFAGAVLMPYQPFLEAAEQARYDIELLGHRFRTSFEQVCHRLTTLSRPGASGVPFHFLRVDIAGNISKRFSGSGIRFARFAGACPRWNVFGAFLTPGLIRTQVSEFEDGTRYFCIACTVRRTSLGYAQRPSLFGVGLGCDVKYAGRLVYADGVDLERVVVDVGVTCRLCERAACADRAFPAAKAPMRIDVNTRGRTSY